MPSSRPEAEATNPRKNTWHVAGLPAVAWPIRAALASDRFDMVVASTDDEENAEVARMHGANVPFLHPESPFNDVTGTRQVIRHAISELGITTGFNCCIYSTAVLATAADL